ncbi:hypothetical protein BG262_09610 [Floricoccus penangensis]|uniref:Uncharacterized protein n=1 Tax=Floricoccus penangensis TaxID=1859475 RepID=A0A9Q5JHE8_9LACT|nr:hypothetical protein [Floricoccus penangensis]OFI47570.1 hypothetical protein BG262_09610 [Floricoccus penangensis]
MKKMSLVLLAVLFSVFSYTSTANADQVTHKMNLSTPLAMAPSSIYFDNVSNRGSNGPEFIFYQVNWYGTSYRGYLAKSIRHKVNGVAGNNTVYAGYVYRIDLLLPLPY